MPSSSSARITRTAISPRLATRTLENTAARISASGLPQVSGSGVVWRPRKPRSWGRGAKSLGGDAQSERVPAGRLIWGRRAGRSPVDHAGADGVVRGLVDEDERAGRP